MILLWLISFKSSIYFFNYVQVVCGSYFIEGYNQPFVVRPNEIHGDIKFNSL